MSVKAIRAATCVNEDSEWQIKEASVELMSAVLRENQINSEDIISVYYTLTPDLKSFNPATAARTELGWKDVPMICAQEAFIEEGLKFCIRALMHVNLKPDQKVQHIYLREARNLRADWCSQ